MKEYENTHDNRRFKPLKYIIPATILSLATLITGPKSNIANNQTRDSINVYVAEPLWENNTQYTDNKLRVVNSKSQGTPIIDPFFLPGTSDKFKDKLNSMTEQQRFDYIMSEMRKAEEFTKGTYNPQSNHQMNSIKLGTDNEAPKINIMTPQSGTDSKSLDYILLERDNKPPVIHFTSPQHQMNYVKTGDTTRAKYE